MAKSENVLIVDDNVHYSKALETFFGKEASQVKVVDGEKEALHTLLEKGPSFYHSIVLDITMERRLSGFFMLWKLRKMNYKGKIIMASTGFDVLGLLPLSRIFLGIFGVHYIVPKKSVLKGAPLFYPTVSFKPYPKMKEKSYSPN